MDSVYIDPPVSDEVRRQRLFEGQLVVLSPKKSTLAFVEFARGLIADAFAPFEPETAQFNMPVEEYANILQALKPKFIHHPELKRHLRNVLEEYGCDVEKTYYEVPKLRSSTSDDYLTTGIAYAWHPHRDTWTAALPSQINWWIPIYELKHDNGLTFYPQYWDKPVKNSSAGYNYYTWNKQHRGTHVSQYLKSDPRPVPRATETSPAQARGPSDLPRRRHHPVLGLSPARERAEYLRRDAVQLRLPHRAPGRHRPEARRAEHRLPVQRPHAERLRAPDRSRPHPAAVLRAL